MSEKNLQRRLNRQLKAEGRVVKKTQGRVNAYMELGSYYCLDIATNTITATHVDLETWLKEGGKVAL